MCIKMFNHHYFLRWCRVTTINCPDQTPTLSTVSRFEHVSAAHGDLPTKYNSGHTCVA